MATGATTKWNIPLFGDSDFVTPIQTPLNAQSNALDTALTNAMSKGGYQGPYPDLATLNLPANAGTTVGQHAIVNNDTTTPTNNGDYVWTGTAWTPVFPIIPYAYVCSQTGSQSIGGGWTLLTAYATADFSRGFSQASGAITVTQPGWYDIAASFSTPTNGTQSFQITKNSATADTGVLLKIQQSGLTAYASRPVLLAANDVIRWFGAAPASAQPVQSTSFISITYKTAR